MTRYSQDALLGAYQPPAPRSPSIMASWLDDAKAELDIRNDTDQDTHILSLLLAAAEQVERDARQIIISQTWTVYFDRFPCHELELRRVPVTAVTHVKYYTSSVLTTLSSALYETDLVSQPARIRPVYGQIWPTTDCRVNAVEVQFVCGYATAAVVPHLTKRVVLSVVRGLYHGCDLGDNYWTMIERLRTFGGVV